jgi:hypothetical protein
MEYKINKNEVLKFEIDLTGRIKLPGQYYLQVVPENPHSQIRISQIEMYYNGNPALDKFVSSEGNTIHVNRTAQVTGESIITIIFNVESTEMGKGNIHFRPGLIY